MNIIIEFITIPKYSEKANQILPIIKASFTEMMGITSNPSDKYTSHNFLYTRKHISATIAKTIIVSKAFSLFTRRGYK